LKNGIKMNNTLSGSVLLFISISLVWHFHLTENRFFSSLPHAHKSFVIYRQGSEAAAAAMRRNLGGKLQVHSFLMPHQKGA
jgi:hypothetical protein